MQATIRLDGDVASIAGLVAFIIKSAARRSVVATIVADPAGTDPMAAGLAEAAKLALGVDEIGLDVHISNEMKRKGINTVADLISHNFRQLYDKLDQFRIKRLAATEAALERLGLQLDEYDPLLEAELAKPIEDLDFAVRAYNALKAANINTVGDLTTRTETWLRQQDRRFNDRVIQEIKTKLGGLGWELATS
jgi:DNA-directed RNA polymerase alpha subunit